MIGQDLRFQNSENNSLLPQEKWEYKLNTQKGFVAIFSVLIIMSIMSLILIGFSTITRQAQVRTLDDQLNTQAFYAAESGINDAKAALLNKPDYVKNTCTGQDTINSFKYNFGASLNVGYTCVLIDPTPSSIRFSAVGLAASGSPQTVTLSPETGTTQKFSVSWDSKTTSDTIANTASADLPTRAVWSNNVGILRLDIVPTSGIALDRGSLVNNAYTLFLYPTTNGAGVTAASFNPGPANQGSITLVNCNSGSTLRCKLDVTLQTAYASFGLRLSAIYNDVQVGIDNVLDATNNTVDLKNGQALVDVTGKANDVFRRVQVRLPLEPAGAPSTYGILSGDSICKRLAVGPTTTVDDGDIPLTDRGACQID